MDWTSCKALSGSKLFTEVIRKDIRRQSVSKEYIGIKKMLTRSLTKVYLGLVIMQESVTVISDGERWSVLSSWQGFIVNLLK